MKTTRQYKIQESTSFNLFDLCVVGGGKMTTELLLNSLVTRRLLISFNDWSEVSCW